MKGNQMTRISSDEAACDFSATAMEDQQRADFWDSLDDAAAEVESWPEWKRPIVQQMLINVMWIDIDAAGEIYGPLFQRDNDSEQPSSEFLPR